MKKKEKPGWLGFLGGWNTTHFIGIINNKPWNKDPVILNQAVFQWKGKGPLGFLLGPWPPCAVEGRSNRPNRIPASFWFAWLLFPYLRHLKEVLHTRKTNMLKVPKWRFGGSKWRFEGWFSFSKGWFSGSMGSFWGGCNLRMVVMTYNFWRNHQRYLNSSYWIHRTWNVYPYMNGWLFMVHTEETWKCPLFWCPRTLQGPRSFQTPIKTRVIWVSGCQVDGKFRIYLHVPWSKVAILGMVIPPLIGILIMGPYKPLRTWVDDHPLLYIWK